MASRGAIRYSPDGSLIAVDSGKGAIALLDASGQRELARLEDPNQHNAIFMSFTPDGTKLLIHALDNSCVHVWDLRRIREGLVELGLDWQAPPYPHAPKAMPTRSLDVRLIGEELPRDPKLMAERERQRPILALAANPFDAAAHAEIGRRLVQSARFEAAYQHLHFARALQQDRFSAWLMLARAANSTGRNTETVEAATRALEQVPPPKDVLFVRAQALVRLGRHQPALEDCEILLKQEPANVTSRNLRALCYWKLGKEDEAIDDYRKVVETRKSTPASLNANARSTLSLPPANRNHLLARATIDAALTKEPANPDFLVTLAVAEWDRGRERAALAALDQAESRPGPRDAVYWFARGVLAADRADTAATRESLTRGNVAAARSETQQHPLAVRLRRELAERLNTLEILGAHAAIAGSAAWLLK